MTGQSLECLFNPSRGCRPAGMTRLAGATPGSGLTSELPPRCLQTGGRARGCSSIPIARCPPPCPPPLQWTVQPHSLGARAGAGEWEEEGEVASSSWEPELDSAGGRKQTQPPPITQGSRGGCSSSLPASVFHSLSFPSASALLPSYCRPPALPPMIHRWCVAVLLCKWALSHLEDGLQAEGSMWLRGDRGPVSGAPG